MRFLLENPLILVILIGVISSFFKKSTEAQPDKKKKSPAKPIQKQDTPFPVGKNRPVRAQKLNPLPPLRPVSNEQIRNEQTEEVLYKGNAKQSASAHEHARRKHREETIAKKTINTDPQTLIDGLIWSEVLGPPRAKKPHRSIK